MRWNYGQYAIFHCPCELFSKFLCLYCWWVFFRIQIFLVVDQAECYLPRFFRIFHFFFFVGKSCLLLVPSEIFIKISKGVILRDNIEMMFLKKMKRLSPQIIAYVQTLFHLILTVTVSYYRHMWLTYSSWKLMFAPIKYLCILKPSIMVPAPLYMQWKIYSN